VLLNEDRRINTQGSKALDLYTGTGSLAAELVKQVDENGFVVGLDFPTGMLIKAKEKAKTLKWKKSLLREKDLTDLVSVDI
jgi:ubiquinone/menaquinone biosynthesis C-methylase UbiE